MPVHPEGRDQAVRAPSSAPATGVSPRSVLAAEWLKYRRTPASRLLLLAPVGTAVLSTWYQTSAGRLDSWPSFLGLVFELWTICWVPLGGALVAALAASMELQAGDWRGLRTRPVRPALLYGSKLLVVWMHLLLSTLLLGALVAVLGSLIGLPRPVTWGSLVCAATLSAVAALPIVTLELGVATALGFAPALALAAMGFLTAALIGGTGLGSGIWPFVPWAWPVRAVAAILTTSGTRESVALAPALGLGLAMLLVPLSLAWFERRDVV